VPIVGLGPFTNLRVTGDRMTLVVPERNRFAPRDSISLPLHRTLFILQRGDEYYVVYHGGSVDPYVGYAMLPVPDDAELVSEHKSGGRVVWSEWAPDEILEKRRFFHNLDPQRLLKTGQVTERNVDYFLRRLGFRPTTSNVKVDEAKEFELKPPFKRLIVHLKSGRAKLFVETVDGRLYVKSAPLLFLGNMPRNIEDRLLRDKSVKVLLEYEPATVEPGSEPPVNYNVDVLALSDYVPEWADGVIVVPEIGTVSITPVKRSKYGQGFYSGILWREVEVPRKLREPLEVIVNRPVIVAYDGTVYEVERITASARYLSYTVKQGAQEHSASQSLV